MNRAGKLSQRTQLSSSLPRVLRGSGGVAGGAAVLPRSLSRLLVEAALLVGSGLLVVALHQALRMPLGLPGRHGVEWMAILVIVRCASNLPAAGSISMAGAAAFSAVPLWGATHDPFIWITYLIPGIVIDLLWRVLPRAKTRVWVTALLLVPIASLAHLTKPIVRWIISLIAGWPYGSFRYGVGYPVLTHALFGLAGGALGVALFYGWKAGQKKLGKGTVA